MIYTVNTLLIPTYTLLTLINVWPVYLQWSAFIVGTLTKKKKKIDFFVDYTAYHTFICICHVLTSYTILALH